MAHDVAWVQPTHYVSTNRAAGAGLRQLMLTKTSTGGRRHRAL